MQRLWLALSALMFACGALAEARAQCAGAPLDIVYQSDAPTDQVTGSRIRLDRVGRVVAPVRVNGQGPFRFIVDTGANRSAVSRDLANRLGLVEVGVADVHTVHDVASAPVVGVESISFDTLSLGSSAAPVLEAAVLAGEDGLLGVDGLARRRLILDFENRCVEIAESRRARRLHDWSVVRGELRFGHLVLVEGRLREHRINVLIDTGSSASLANQALRDVLEAAWSRRRSVPVEPARLWTAGEPILLSDAVIIPRMGLGEIEIEAIVAFLGDFHIFDLWGLRDEPTLLIGMDVLAQTRAIAIDYERSSIHFRLAREGRRLRQF